MVVKYNFPYTCENIEGFEYLTTRFKVADYVTEDNIYEALDNIDIPKPSEIIVRKISDRVDFSGLTKNKIFDFIKTNSPKFSEILSEIKSKIPLDNTEDINREICEWMLDMCAANIELSCFEDEYNRYSNVLTGAGDGNIPGVRISELSFRSEPGYSVHNRGYAIAFSPVGIVDCKNYTKTTIVGKNFLGCGLVHADYTYQWCGALIRWVILAKAKIGRKLTNIRFPSFFGIVSPNFFVQDPEKKVEAIRVIVRLSSDKDQKVNISFLNPIDYRKTLDSLDISVDRGVCDIEYSIASYPYVPPVVLKLDPQTTTVLKELNVLER